MVAIMLETLMSRLAIASLQSLLLAAALWALCRAWPRLPAATRCLLWWLASLQLLLGLLWPAPLELPLLPAPTAATATATASTLMPAVIDAAAAAPAAVDAAAQSAVRASPLPLITVASDTGAVTGFAWSWTAVLAWLWLSGVIMTALQSLLAYRQARRWRRHSSPCERADVLAIYRAIGAGMRLERLPPLRVADDIRSPQLLGPWRPVVLLPAAALEHFSADELQMALRHELTHLRRGDLWWGWLPVLARHLFFFHPAAYLIEREYAFAREAACDESVLACRHHSAQDYGRLLLRLGVAPRPSAGMASASPTYTLLKRRLVMLQNTGAPPRLIALALAVGIVLLGALPYRVIAGAGVPSSAPAAVVAPRPSAPMPAPAPVPAARAAVAAVAAANAVAAPSPVAAARSAPAPAPVAVAAAPAHPTVAGRTIETRGDGDDNYAYVLMFDGHTTASAQKEDFAAARRASGNSDETLLWLRKDGAAYVVRDGATLQRMHDIWKAVGDLGEQQGSLGEQQGELGKRQGRLGGEMGQLGAQMGAIGQQRASIATRSVSLALEEGAETDRLRAALDRETAQLDTRQADLDRKMSALAGQQQTLGDQQAALGEKQAALGERQQAESDRAHARMKQLIDEVIASGVAQPARR